MSTGQFIRCTAVSAVVFFIAASKRQERDLDNYWIEKEQDRTRFLFFKIRGKGPTLKMRLLCHFFLS
jgi:hypothetical protein